MGSVLVLSVGAIAEEKENSVSDGKNEGLVYFVSWVATVSTIGLFSSGFFTVRKIHQNKNVGSLTYVPFIAASLNCSLWTMYGILKPDTPITYINITGLLLQLFYISVYFTYTENKYKLQRDFMVALALVLSITFYYTYISTDHQHTVNQMGIICNFFTIIFFASPLITMTEVMKSKSTETMSLPLTVMSLATASSWVVYGILQSDPYIIFPNSMGLLLACIQLSLFLRFPRQKKLISIIETPLV